MKTLSLLEQDVSRIRYEKLMDWEVARSTLDIFKRVLEMEASTSNLRDAIDIFTERLWAGPRFRAFLEELHRRCLGIIYQFDCMAPDDLGLADLFSADLYELISFYQQRKSDLAFLGDGEESDKYRSERIYGFHIAHERGMHGLEGMEICCSLQLNGRFSQALWLKAQLSHNDSAVQCSRGWSSWQERVLFNGESSSPHLDRSFAALMPIVPDAQRLIVNGARIFVPYAALGLPAGQHEIEIDLSLIDEEGSVILKAAQSELIYIPASSSREIPIPSPQSITMWPADIVAGDGFHDVKVHLHKVDRNGAPVINLRFDLSLAGHAGEPLLLECRILDSNEELVDSLNPDFVDERGAFVFREPVRPYTMLARFRDLGMQIPLDCLKLGSGRHALLCELSVLDSRSRVLCGIVHRVECFVTNDRLAPGGLEIDRIDGQSRQTSVEAVVHGLAPVREGSPPT